MTTRDCRPKSSHDEILENPFFVSQVLRYARTSLELPESEWEDVQSVMTANWPEVTQVGDKLSENLRSIGRASFKERRDSFRYLERVLKLRGKVAIVRQSV